MPSRILVIDDEADVLKLLKFRLEKAGYEVITALDGIKGVELALNARPDLIILDIMLPGGDGYTICEKLKHSSAAFTIPIIFLSAKTEDRDVIRGYAAGAVFYLKKPYESDILLDTVKKALEAPQELEKEAQKKIKRLLVLTRDSILKRTIQDNFSEIIELNFIQGEQEFRAFPSLATLDVIVFDLLLKEIDFVELLKGCKGMFGEGVLLVLVTDASTQVIAEKISSGIKARYERLNRPFEIGSLELLLKEVLKK